MNPKNIFRGEKGIFNYLVPGATGPTPAVELPSRLNPYLQDGVHVYIKLVPSVPLANIKSLPAWYMLHGIPKKELAGIKHLVEYGSGNTAMSLTILGRHFGIPKMHALISPEIPKSKQDLMRLVGTDIIISEGPASPDVHGTEGGVWDAKQMGKKQGWKNLNQYINLNSPRGIHRIVGKELYGQFGKKINILCMSLGTGATVVGTGSYLKNKIPDLYLIATSVKKDSSIPGPRGEDAVKKLEFPWWKIADVELPIAERPAYEMSLRLVREGLFVGPSTGMQLAGILQTLKKMKREKKLKKNTNVVFVACDTMFPYIEDYFAVLPEKLKR